MKPKQQVGVKASKKNKVSKKALRESLGMGSLAIPGIALLLVFNYAPMVGNVIAFKNYKPLKGIWGSDWNGLENFKFFFNSSDAIRTIRNTMLYNFSWMILGTIVAVGLALMFYSLRNAKALKFYNTVILFPRFMSAVVVAFLAEIFLHTRYGLLNQLMEVFGKGGVDWYTVVDAWPTILTIVYLWGHVGVMSVIYYAALMGLDDGLLEASTLDGANKWHQIWNVMIPHLVPTIIIQNLLSIGKLFTGDFGLFYQVPKDTGVLYPVTDIINTYTYRALQSGDMARGAAVGLFQSVAGLITVVLANHIVKKINPENSLF